MGQWLARLKNQNIPDTLATKPTKPLQGGEKAGFVGFVAYPPRGLKKIEVPDVVAAPSPLSASSDPATPAAAMVTSMVYTAEANSAVNTALVNRAVNTESADWRTLDQTYQAHHVGCPTCMAAGKGYGLRCGTGAALWAAYSDVQPPERVKVPSRLPASATHTPTAEEPIHTSPVTAATEPEIQDMQYRLALFTDRGLSLNDAERLVDKLLVRDRESDVRGVCAECRRLTGYGPGRWKCSDKAPVLSHELAGAFLGATFVHLNLHRCFSFMEVRT